MDDGKLLSLREIASQLQVNYRTMIDIKNRFEDYLPERMGNNSRYPPACVGFFRMLLTLKRYGYTYEMVAQVLEKQLPLPANDEIRNMIVNHTDKFSTKWTDEDGCGWMEMDEDGCRCTGMDGDGCGCTKMDGDGCERMGMDEDGCGWMEMDVSNPESLAKISEIVKQEIQPLIDTTSSLEHK